MRNIFLAGLLLICSACVQLPPSPVLPAPFQNKQAVVFDIDGTLTPEVVDIFTARAKAAEVANTIAQKGYQIIYLSTRNGWFSSGIPAWLEQHHFPKGVIHVAQTRDERCHADVYKTGMLKQYTDLGWKIEYAFGDSDTDFIAYHNIGLPQERVFALRRASYTVCQSGIWAKCLNGWEDYLQDSRNLPEARGGT